MYECTYTYTSSTTPQIESSLCVASSTVVASSSDIAFLGSFTAGEIVISLLLVMLIAIVLTINVIKALFSIKTKLKYLRYSGGDVESD